MADEGRLAGRYVLQRELGRGASGRVLLALDSASEDAPRAIKLVDAGQEARLRWELGVLAAIAHPNLARVYELLRVERPSPSPLLPADGVALVTELAPGRPASAWAAELVRDRQALLALALMVADGVARALSALHAHGLVHGDVKPANIVVSDDRESCKLIDLGLAAETTRIGSISGTPGYMAPELWRGERGPAADLYALGVTLHDLLRGAPTSDEHTISAAEHARRALMPPTARVVLTEDVPAALVRLIEGLIEPDPAARVSRAGEVCARVASIALDSGVALASSADRAADDAPSPEERALAVTVLPLVGHAAALDVLCAGLAQPGSVVVWGPHGSGRSRLVREAVRRLQSARVAAGLSVPTYRVTARLPEGALGGDCVLHLEEADGVTSAEVAALLQAAAVEDCAVSLVLERSAPLPIEDGIEVALAPLSEGELRRLLERALPGVRITAAHVREALTVSGGLSGRLCRSVAAGLTSGADMSRAASLRVSGDALHDDPAALSESSRTLAELLAVAGGELGPVAAQAALGSADALARAYRALLTAGLATRTYERLCLRDDLIATLRNALTPARLRALAARLPEVELDGRARGHLWLARGERQHALASFTDEIARLRERGLPERAALCAGEALASVGDLDIAHELRLRLADALRAQGRYADARAALAEVASARGLALRAELERLSGEREQARRLAESSLASAGDDPSAAVLAEVILARLSYDAGEIDRAERLVQSAIARGGSESASLRAQEVLVLVLLHRGERDRALSLLGAALDRAKKSRLREAEARLTALSAQLARDEGDPHVAARRYAAAFELAEAAGEQHAAAAFLHNVGVQRLDCGEPGPAIAALRESARRLARLGRDADLGRVLYNLGHAAQSIGQDDIALGSAQRARQAALRAGDHTTRAYVECLEAELRLRLGERKTAAALLSQPLELDALPREVRAIVAARHASLHLGLGEIDAAEHELEDSQHAAAAAQSEAAEVEYAIACCQLDLARGRIDEARRAAERAHALAQRGGSFDARLRACLCAARAARAAGDASLSAVRLADVRSMLDQAARGLSPSERARLRAVDAYRAAFEAVPTESGIAALPAHDERWRALAGVAKRLTAERRLPRLYEAVLDAAIELAGAERGYLVLKDRDGIAQVRAGRGLERRAVAAEEQLLSRSIVARVLGSGRPLTTMDAASDDQLSSAASVHALSLRSVLAVPLRIRGEVAGAIYLEDRLRPFAFGEVELSLLSDLSDLASIALDSARLLRAESRAGRRLAALRARLAHKVEAQALELESLKRVGRDESSNFAGIIGHSQVMQRVLGMVGKLGRSSVPVLISGESGTGKELVAHAIHSAGRRKGAPFVSENCGAIPEPLLESALFGHVRGAFTGADRRRLGLFEVADGGTLFLDEIGEMSLAMQSRLLRVLEDGEVRPVGGERARHVDVRVLAATNRDLETMVAEGRFREDLYYRLAVVTLGLPALRERTEDIEPLIAHLIAKHAPGRTLAIDRRALAALIHHPWPGNVRQLENEIRRALVLADAVIAPEHLSPGLLDAALGAPPEPLDLRGQVDQLERKLIRQALETAAGNQTRAARILGVSRYGLQKMIRRLELGEADNLN